MRLPGAAAYMEAVQDPGGCFADPELAAAVAVLGPLGLPRAVSGNVAVVFRLDGAAGRSWAVRCFVRPLDAERARYDAIRSHLAGLRSSWRVPFDLQPCGIRVDGKWWPVLKMDWAPAEPLLAYVARHLWDGPALAYLASRVAALSACLRADGVAHGDLQHGNILVAPGGDLRLVDYDGMYVPALAGREGTERGHRNYQHPGRGVGDFGPGLDSFSSWVIYASLAALSADPLLWGRVDGGEEALLLRHHDLEHPGKSAVLAAMETSDGPGVAELAGLLRSFLAVGPDDVPSLSLALAPPLTGIGPDDGSRKAVPGALCRGWPGNVTAGPGAALYAPPPVGAAAGPAAPSPAPAPAPVAVDDAGARGAAGRRSLFDALTATPATAAGGPARAAAHAPPPPPPVAFTGDLETSRRTLAAGVAAAAAVPGLALVTGVPLPVALAVALVVVVATLARVHQLFRATPEAAAAGQVRTVLAEPRQAVDGAAAVVDGLLRRRDGIAASEAAAASRADSERAALRAGEADELRVVDAALEVVLAGVAVRERAVARAEQAARGVALGELRSSVMDAHLAKHSLVSASAAGVSDTVVYRLALDDVRTAADFTDVVVEKSGGVVVGRDGRRLHVKAVDRAQAAAMLAWRRRVSGVAQLKMPDALSREQVAAIRATHDRHRAALAAEAAEARAAARAQADGIRGRWQARHDVVVERQKAVEAEAAGRRVELDRELAQARKGVAEAEWNLARHHEHSGVAPELRLADYLRQVVGVGPLAPLMRRGSERVRACRPVPTAGHVAPGPTRQAAAKGPGTRRV